MKEEELKRGNWRLASISGGDHLERTLEMYRELGIEVYLEEVDLAQCGECTECYQAGFETTYRIYTKAQRTEEIDNAVPHGTM